MYGIALNSYRLQFCLFSFLMLNICVTNDHGYVPLVINTYRSFPYSRLITGFVTRLTRRVPLVEQELLTLPEHLSSPPFLVGFLLLNLLFYMYVLSIVVCPFVVFLLAIVLSVLLRYTVSDCPFGIYKLFLSRIIDYTKYLLKQKIWDVGFFFFTKISDMMHLQLQYWHTETLK